MKVENTSEISSGDNIVMVIYGGPKVGKTSFVASSSKVGKTLIVDFENGSKCLGERGFDCDVIRMKDWFDRQETGEFLELVKKYDTVAIDPAGEGMDFLISGNQVRGSKMRQPDGSLTSAGWGEVKRRMRGLIKFLTNSGKNVILVFHDDRYIFENEMYHSLMIATKLKDVIPGMVEIVSYLTVIKRDDGLHHVLYTPVQGGNYDSGDRTGRVPEVVEVSEDHGWEDFLAALKPKEYKTFDEPSDIEEEYIIDQGAVKAQEPPEAPIDKPVKRSSKPSAKNKVTKKPRKDKAKQVAPPTGEYERGVQQDPEEGFEEEFPLI